MSLVIPPGYASAAFVFTGAVGTQPYITTLGVSISEAGGDHVAVADRLMKLYEENMLSATTTSLTLEKVTLSIGNDGPSGSVDSTRPPKAGSSSGNFPPTAMSAIARKVTNQLGRSGRGRMFLPGVVGETDVDASGQVSSGRRTAVDQQLEFFVDALNLNDAFTGPLTPYLFHSVAPTTPTLIESLSIAVLVGWIRGRIR